MTTKIEVKLLLGLFFLLSFAGFCVASENDFTIAVASDSPETTGQISKVAARAAYFLFFDKDGNLVEPVTNPHGGVTRGAGPRAADFLIKKNIQVVIAGHFGSKMANALETNNIQYIERHGIVIDEVKKLIDAR